MTETLKVTRTIDNRLNLNNERSYDFTQGCGFISYVNYSNQSSNIGNTINITCNPPNRNIVVSRRVMKTAEFTVTLTGTTTGDTLLNDQYHGPAFMPIMQITTNETMRLGNTTITQTNMVESWRALLTYSNDIKNSDACYSLSASMPDQAQTFEELEESSRSPFQPYSANVLMTPRSALYSYKIVSNTATQAVVTFKVSEPLFMSPFVFGSNAGNMPGFVGIETMQYSATFGNKNLAFSYIAGQAENSSTITSVSTVVNSFNLGFEYLTPQVNMAIPRSLICSYFQPYLVSSATGTPLAYGDSAPMPQIRIQLEGIPRRVYLFAGDAVSDFSPTNPSTFLSLADQIGCVSVRMNGIPSLESHDRQAIYEICRTNGYANEYSQFSKYTGSVVCLDWSRDIACNPEQAPGLAQMNEFQVQIRVTNTGARTINNPTFYCVVIYDGIFSVTDGMSRHVINPLSASDIMNAPFNDAFKQSNLPADVYGGSFWGKVKDFANKGVRFVKDHKLISKGLALAGQDEAARLAESYGLGISGGGISGGGISGGRLISRKQLTMAPRY